MASMEHLIGQRFSLISKSQIRYEGILHEINPEQSTIALEEVYSFGTEDRQVDNFIPSTNQKYDYIVFRGSDVKDISIVEGDKPKEPEPSNVPNDPAILNSSRPGLPPSGPSQGPPQNRGQSPYPPGYPPPPQQQFGQGPAPGFYPPHQPYGRGFGPPPGPFGPGPGFHPYGPPPPGYFGPPGQGFPHGPGQFQQPPPPIGPPGQRHNGPNQPPQHSPPEQTPRPNQAPQATSELPVEIKAASKDPTKSSTPVPPAPPAPTPVQTKPTEPQPAPAPPTMANIVARPPPTQPKGGKVAPAMPFTVNQKSFVPPLQAPVDATNGAKPAAKTPQSRSEIDDAQAKAREAVAAALAKVAQPSGSAAAPVPTAASMDALSKRMAEMGPSAPAMNGTHRGRGGFRGGRAGYPRVPSGGQQPRKIEIPKSDYDFESANAKFNKDDLIKEAIASGSPTVEAPEEKANGTTDEPEALSRNDSIPTNTGKAYNKATSFFDNISSEAKEREDGDARANARQHRGQEFQRNVETFGQGNVDGSFRGRGRGGYGRGGGGFGRGRQYGGGNFRGGYNRGGFGARGRGGPQGLPATENGS